MAQGLTNAQIGTRLHVSLASVKAHLSHILTKLGVDKPRVSRPGLITSSATGSPPESTEGPELLDADHAAMLPLIRPRSEGST
ncbi:response regulator transcription factor [Tessaracoccus coleopterorum]|uniref:response regulator transcription factor n=1 Tax=Tessaracoccus coleopterorum TaxID=2714950 RepID=UPI001E54E3F7|nr:helix-turn-helix transcriptional regulator [Tessaracoccus coleopterorum]